MKSFFQRFHDSQPGASKSRAKDVVYRQRTPSFQVDKDHSQLDNSAEHETNTRSKQRAPKSAGVQIPCSGVHSRVSQFSAVPVSSTSGVTLPPLPLPQSHPLSKAPNLKPLNDSKEKAGSSSKRNEVIDLFGNENNAVSRTKSERPGRSRQTSTAPVSQESAANAQMGTENRRNKERLTRVDESDTCGTWPLRRYDNLDGKEKRLRKGGPDQQLNTDKLQWVQSKDEERRDHYLGEILGRVRGRVVEDVQRWEHQEGGKEESKEKEKQNNRTREKKKDKDEDRNDQKEKERVREREREREKDSEREGERNKEKGKRLREKMPRDMNAKQFLPLREQAYREAKEQQKKERRGDELGNQERGERKAREARKQQAERDHREQLELQRKEREHRAAAAAAEQRERERQQQEIWEREQDERERKERERLNRVRRREERWRKEVCQRESDHKKEDLFKPECERQDQRNSKEERGEEESERKCGDRERHWRSGRHREISEAALTNTRTNDKGTTHPGQRVSDSERDVNKTERRRLSPSATQTNTPFESEERIYSYGEAACSAKVTVRSRKSELDDPPGRTDTSIHCHEDLQQLSQEGWYAPEVGACRKGRPSYVDDKISQQNVAGQDLHGYGANPLRPRLLSTQEIRSSPSAHTQLLVEPTDNPAFATSTRLVECSVSIVPPTYKSRVTSSDIHTSSLEDSSHVNRLPEEGPRKIRTSVPDVQPSSQQSSLDAIKTTRPSFPANPTSIDHQLQGNQPAVSNSNALIAAIERPHDNLFPSTVTHSLPSHVLPNNTQDTISSKDTRISEPTEVHAQSIVEPSEVKTAQELLEYPSSVLNPSLNSPISQNSISGQGQKHHLGAPITDSAGSHVQNSSLTQHNLYDTPLPQSSVSNSTLPTDPPAEGPMIASKQEIGPQESRQKEVYAQQLSQNLSLNPLSPVAVPLCSVIADKQSNIEPSKNESRQDPMTSLISTNPTQPSCLSPSHVSSKIYDGTPGYNDKILPHHSNKDSIQMYADRTLLQETAPSLSRQETSEKFDRQENQIRTPISPDQIQRGRIQSSDTLGARRHHRDHVSARAAPPIENPPLRHRRYHSDTETGYQGNNPFPRSHLAESSHVSDSHLTRPGRSKHKPNTKETELESPRVDVREGNIAFRTPVPGILEPATATYGKHSATVPLLDKPISFQETSEHGSHKRKLDARGLPVLVSHNKQLEGTARHGGQIAMTGTTILRSKIQSDVPSPPARVVVPSPFYPQSLAAPEVDQLNTIVGIRSPVSGAFLLQSRDIPDTSSRQGQSSMAQSQATYFSNAQFENDTIVCKDNTRNSAREAGVIHPAQPRPRKQSSPQVRPRDDQSKLSSSKGGNIDDDPTSRPRQAPGDSRGTASCADVRYTQRTETTRTEDVHTSDHQLGLCPSTYVQLPSTDDKNRNRYDSGNHPSQLTPPPNPATVSPQRTNTFDAEFDAGNRKDSTQIKNSRLAELLSLPKPSDIPLHSYSPGARRHLAYNSPSLAHQHSGNEESSRSRGTSSREEHASRHGLTEDSSPFGNTHSFPSNPQPDLSIKGSGYSRPSPDTSHITPSFRARDLVADNHTFQSGSVPPREMSRSVSTGYPHRQSSARERQDMISDTEKVLLPKYNHDAELRIGERSKSSHVGVPVSTLQTRKKISQKDIARKNAEEPSQPVASTHIRTRSDPHIMPDSTVLGSRHAYNELCNATLTQPETLPASVISSSEPTIPFLSQLSDQSQNSQSYSSNLQSPTVREEVPVPPPSTEISSMKSSLSRKNHITPLFPDASNHGSLNSQSSSSQTYEIWLPSTSSWKNEIPSRSIPISGIRRDLERARDRAGQSARCLPYQPYTMDPLLANAYHYIKTRKMRTMSTASLEAQDGAASTVVGSPTTSILSQTPINIPPEQDPILAARKWTEAGAICPGQRIRRPGLVWELPEDPPPIYQQEHRRPEPRSRRSRLPNSRTRETGDTD